MNLTLKKIEELRKSYIKGSLDLADLSADPMELFYRWLEDAIAAEVPEPNAMTLATVNAEGKPSARTVLLKVASSEGFEFFTNYLSPKGKDLEHNPHAAIVFLWKEIERQVRIEGIAEKLTYERSQTYFQSRPRGSQIGAWASPQSQVIPDRKILEDEADKYSQQFENVDPLPCPEFWGGYIIRPSLIEFWHGRLDRLHDRFRYTLDPGGENWSVVRLAP